jgi:hypothetical protein
MYSPTYNWPTRIIPNIINDIYRRSYEHIVDYFPNEIHELDNLIRDFEEYLYQCYRYNLINQHNEEYILEKLKTLNVITLLPHNERGFHGKYQNNCVFINPNLNNSRTLNSAARQRLFTFHELGHFLIDTETAMTIDTIEECGWKLLEEGIAQEIAEELTYASLNLPRPTTEWQTYSQLFD